MVNAKAKFMGWWSDETCRLLIIKKVGALILADVLLGEEKFPATRDLLGNDKLPSVNMKTYFDCGRLNVELGTEGLGPFLQIEYRKAKLKHFRYISVLRKPFFRMIFLIV